MADPAEILLVASTSPDLASVVAGALGEASHVLDVTPASPLARAKRIAPQFVDAAGAARSDPLLEGFSHGIAESYLRESPEGLRLVVDGSEEIVEMVEVLHQVLPEAHVLFVYRDPLAVFLERLSLQGWDWSALKQPDQRAVLIDRPKLMTAMIRKRPDAVGVSFESVLDDPESILGRILKESGWSDGGIGELEPLSPPDASLFSDLAIRRVARSYLDALGKVTVTEMGYDWDDLEGRLVPDRDGGPRYGRWIGRTPPPLISWSSSGRTDRDPADRSAPDEGASVGEIVPGLVSIITPCLDPGLVIGRNCKCVEVQTYPDIEHIVIDGGSDEATLRILRSRPHIRWISEPDGGQADAINKGLALARGEFVTWLNSDDYLDPDVVRSAVDAFRAHPKAGVIFGDIVINDHTGRRLRRGARRIRQHALDKSNPIPQPGTFVRMSALRKVGWLDDSLDLVMDYDLWCRLEDAGIGFKHIPRVMATFEIHDRSKTGTNPPSAFLQEIALMHIRRGRLPQAKAALDRGSWHDVYARIHTSLAEGKGRTARSQARAGWRMLNPPKRRLMSAFLLTTYVSPLLSRFVLRVLGRTPPADGG